MNKVSKNISERLEEDLVYKKLDLEEDNKLIKNDGTFNLDNVLQTWLEFDDDELNINEL